MQIIDKIWNKHIIETFYTSVVNSVTAFYSNKHLYLYIYTFWVTFIKLFKLISVQVYTTPIKKTKKCKKCWFDYWTDLRLV